MPSNEIDPSSTVAWWHWWFSFPVLVLDGLGNMWIGFFLKWGGLFQMNQNIGGECYPAGNDHISYILYQWHLWVDDFPFPRVGCVIVPRISDLQLSGRFWYLTPFFSLDLRLEKKRTFLLPRCWVFFFDLSDFPDWSGHFQEFPSFFISFTGNLLKKVPKGSKKGMPASPPRMPVCQQPGF